MKAIIWGANGQDGHYLSQLLTRNNIDVTGISRSGDWLQGDVSDYAFVKQIIKNIQPDYIFHLAANSTTRHDVWLENHHTICDGTLYILESVKDFCPKAKVFISGSGLQFINSGNPIKESDPFYAGSPYAVSRIQSVYAARYYRSLGLHTYAGYFFNHDSPLRSERHMSKKIAQFAKRIAAGQLQTMEIGDIYTEKEWGFAGDTVAAIWTLVNQQQVFETVIGTGLAYSIKDWLDECFKRVGIDWTEYVIRKNDFTPEYNRLVSNPETLVGLGWEPEISFTNLAQMMMSDNG
jgi:GDPmannose 4,6-dehydratase